MDGAEVWEILQRRLTEEEPITIMLTCSLADGKVVVHPVE